MSNWEVFKTEFYWNVHATCLHTQGSLYTSCEGELACTTGLSATHLTCIVSTIPHRSCYLLIIKHNTITYYNKCSLTCSCNMVICDKSKFQSVIQHWIKPVLKVFSLFMWCHQSKLRCIWSNSILVWNKQSKTGIIRVINS